MPPEAPHVQNQAAFCRLGFLFAETLGGLADRQQRGGGVWRTTDANYKQGIHSTKLECKSH